MQVHERISALMEAKKLSVSTLAHIIGKTEKVVYNYREGKNEPTVGVFERIILKYPDINAQWLLTGYGSMIVPAPDPSALSEPPMITFGGTHTTNSGVVGGDMVIGLDECRSQLSALRTEVQLLREQTEDKKRIIQLLSERQ